MQNNKLSFRSKILIPTMIIFITSTLLIFANSYRLLYSTVQTKTNEKLDIFSEEICVQINHLNIILDILKQTLNKKHIAISKCVSTILADPSADLSPDALQELADSLDIIELSVSDTDGILTYCNIPELIGFDYKTTEGLDEIAKGNFDARIEGDYNDEFAVIKNAVNDMADSIIEHLQDKLQAERAAQKLELARLDLLIKANCDMLTGIYNRRYLDDTFTQNIQSLADANKMLSILIIDIDFFKEYNDTYGHHEGDQCLKSIARALENAIEKEGAFAARYGEDEFIMVLPDTDENNAIIVAKKIFKNIKELNLSHEQSTISNFVTISMGITTSKVSHSQAMEDYIKRADEALYQSKKLGRNKYTFRVL